jgi:two-component system LytT family sensor kinase
MKIRWRQHEMTLATTIFVILGIGYFRDLVNIDASQYSGAFVNNHVPFNLYRNVVLPDIGIGILIYSAYLLMNLFMLRRFYSLQKYEAGTSQISLVFNKVSMQAMIRNVLGAGISFLIQATILIFLLGTALNIAIYYKHEWQFHYPGFSFFPKKGYNPNSMIDIGGPYAFVFFVTVIYCLYLLLREFVIRLTERSGNKRAFRTLICNQVTITMVYYVALPVFLMSFHLIHDYSFFPAYYLVTLALFLMYMSNMYWLFPMKGNTSFFTSRMISRVLISAFFFSFPLMAAIHENGFVAFLYAFLFQLFIVTPLTWLIYQQKKDKILQLRGTEKALVKSRTDLQFLRSQINPHFLFNVLNTLYGTALEENAQRTSEGIQRLGDMMRFMLHENHLDFIDLHKEVGYLENYIALQKLRTQSSRDIIIEDNINIQNCNYKIAPMLLIPFVENAFKHGISLQEKSWIRINLSCDEKNIFFEVYNSMHTRNENDPEKEKSGIGFRNVIERLKLIYPCRHQISVNGDGKEFFVKLAIEAAHSS